MTEPLARPITECVRMIFPTPLASHPWPDSEGLNAELEALVLRLEREHGAASAGRSNIGGWHSTTDFLSRSEPCIVRLNARIRTLIGAMTRAMMKPGVNPRVTVEGWANVLRAGQYNALHLHPNSTWSGVYYVTGNPPPDGGDAAFSGKIEFADPRPGASASYTIENTMQQRTMLNPSAGTMIAFPSWLQHHVHPYFGPAHRISVAFNVLLVDQQDG